MHVNIADIALFKGLSNVDLAKVLGRLERRTLRADETLFRAGDPGTACTSCCAGRSRST